MLAKEDAAQGLRRFFLLRNKDLSGISGVGRIAEGILFHDGQVVLSWFGRHHTIEVSPTLQDTIDIHGHSGHTVIEWLDEEEGLNNDGKPN